MSRLVDEQVRIKAGGEIGEGKYRLVRPLGEGGMGFVWQAQQTGIGGFEKAVALKLILEPENRKEARRLFLNEARLSARLHHPNLIEIYDVGQDGDLDYIAMELIDGMDLGVALQLCATQGKQGLPWELAAAIVSEACKGLSYAHQKRDHDGSLLHLIHRDLKPGNIIVSKDGFVKIIDFGIAKSTINNGKTKTGLVKGTPAYMAPEQLASEVLDARADIYAMGTILYELCCGRAAFEGDTLFTILFAVQTKQPIPPSHIAKDLPERIETIILRCLTKDREARYATAKDLQRALEGALSENNRRIEHEELGLFIGALESAAKRAGETLPTEDKSAFSTTEQEAKSLVGHEAHTFDLVAGRLAPKEELPHSQAIELHLAKRPIQLSDSRPFSPSALSSPMMTSTGFRIGMVSLIVLLLISISGILFYSAKSKSEKARTKTIAQAAPRVVPRKHRVTKKKVPESSSKKSAAPAKTKRPITKRRHRRAQRRSVHKRRKVALKRRRKPPAVKVRKAALFVDFQPRCQILKDSVHVGISNGVALLLPPGKHTLRCVNYNKRFVHPFQVHLKPGTPTRITRRFQRGRLFVLSFPFSTLSLGSHGISFGHIGRSHDHIQLYEGTYQLILHKLGNAGIVRKISIVMHAKKLTRPKVIW